jgi:hypothetical protein
LYRTIFAFSVFSETEKIPLLEKQKCEEKNLPQKKLVNWVKTRVHFSKLSLNFVAPHRKSEIPEFSQMSQLDGKILVFYSGDPQPCLEA